MNRLELIALACGYEVIQHETMLRSYIEIPNEKPRWFDRWNPEADPADCFRVLEALCKQGAVSIPMAGKPTISIITPSLNILDGNGETLQEAICNLAVEVGRSMNEEG